MGALVPGVPVCPGRFISRRRSPNWSKRPSRNPWVLRRKGFELWSRFAALWFEKTALWLGWVAADDGGAAVDAGVS